MESIRGTLTYVEDIPLAPESVVRIELLDVSAGDAAGTPVAESMLQMPGRPPLTFALKYDANQIEAGHRYALNVEVHEQKRLMFVSDRRYPVLDKETQAPVEITLKHVPGGRLERMAENVRATNPILSGHYRYYDGDSEFVDCETEKSHPLAREHGIYSLESEYRDVAPQYGDEVFVRVAGKYVTRPARAGRGNEDYLVVKKVEEMYADGDCP
jgi:putative lipoprotein